MRPRILTAGMAAVVCVLACSGSAKTAPQPERAAAPAAVSDERKPAPPPPPPPVRKGPVNERAEILREAANQLEKAQTALDNGNRNLAEQLFSTAELLVGPDAVASVARLFREGGPPRVTTPTQKVDTAGPPQPRVSGSSEVEDEKDRVPPPRIEGSLAGTMTIDGRAADKIYGLITLEPADGKWKPRTPKKVTMEQRNREFLPHVMAVSVGSTITFPNSDTVFHNVFSTSPAAAFDLGLYKVNEAREFTFQKEGIVRLGCNLHANMSAYIAVVAAPAYVVTDEQGRFSFKHLPPGKYKLRAWSERSKAPITQDVTIKVGKNDVTVGVSGDATPGPLPDKFGGKRG